MKKLTAVILVGLITLIGFGIAFASDDHDSGYHSKFYGSIEVLPAERHGLWIVNGRSVQVTPQTKIKEKHGRAAVGAYVEIRGSSDGQTFHAQKVEIKQQAHHTDDVQNRHHADKNKFYGNIKTMPQGALGTWMIDDKEVHVDPKTRIEEEYGPATIGSIVKVKGTYREGRFYAREIEVKNSH